jgi:hypothetical protein
LIKDKTNLIEMLGEAGGLTDRSNEKNIKIIRGDPKNLGGHAGPLYIILPDSYAGPKEKMILKSFPDYKGWYGSMLSNKYVMYGAK